MFTIRNLAANLLIFFLYQNAFSQNLNSQWNIFIGGNSVDLFPAGAGKDAPYYPQGEIFEDFLNVGDHWNSSGRSVSISKSFFRTYALGINVSVNNITKIEGYNNIDYPYYAGEVFAKKTFRTKKKLQPYLKVGYGITGIDRGIFGDTISFSQYFSRTISPGVGIQIKLTKNIGIELQSSFQNAVDFKGIKHFRHQAGVYLAAGNRDKDDDGVFNRKDKCPKIPGLEELFGCPDSDNDGVADPDDNCPNEIGTIKNNGCPEKIEDIEKVEILSDQNSTTISETESITLEDSGKSLVKTEQDPDKDSKDGQASKSDQNLSIYFPADSYRILGRKTFDILADVRDYLTSKMDKYLILQGYASGEGDEEYNLELSKSRANAVKDYLIFLGIEPVRIEVKAFGASGFVNEQNSEKERLFNRRVEIIFR